MSGVQTALPNNTVLPKPVLFYSKWVKGRYDFTTPEERAKGLKYEAEFNRNHFATDNAILVERMIAGQHYKSTYWIIKKPIPSIPVSSLTEMSLGGMHDIDIVIESRARAEAIAATGNDSRAVEAVDGDLTRLLQKRQAERSMVDVKEMKDLTAKAKTKAAVKAATKKVQQANDKRNATGLRSDTPDSPSPVDNDRAE